MTTYRVGDHHGVTIVREGDGARCGRPDHDCDRGHLVGVMLTAEDAELVVEALNGRAAHPTFLDSPRDLSPEEFDEFRTAWQRALGEKAACGRTNPHMPHDFGEMFDEECAGIPSPEPPVEHRASSPGGDGLGYGPCVGCGELWPCTASRGERP